MMSVSHRRSDSAILCSSVYASVDCSERYQLLSCCTLIKFFGRPSSLAELHLQLLLCEMLRAGWKPIQIGISAIGQAWKRLDVA